MHSLRLILLLPLSASCASGPNGKRSDTGATGDDSAQPQGVVDADMDGFSAEEDCDDSNPEIHPDADEICNDIDDDCDRLIDDTDDSLHPVGLTEFFVDADGDGFGDPEQPVRRCEATDEVSTVAGDCDDTRPTIHPDAEEVCGSGFDENCDGLFNEACGISSFTEGGGEALISLNALPQSELVGTTANAYSLFPVTFDLDGDGLEDTLIGDPNQTYASDSIGVIHALWGDGDPATPLPNHLDIALHGARPAEAQDATYIGRHLTVLQDVTGDARSDLVVAGEEAVWLVEQGNVSPDVASPITSMATWSLPMTAAAPSALGNAGDIDDDGYSELMVGEQYQGIYLFWGAELAATSSPELSDALLIRQTDTSCLGMGKRGSATGIDLDGDGFSDLAIGCRDTWHGTRGEVVILEGVTLSQRPTGILGPTQDDACITGRELGWASQLGRITSSAGDLNHDGYPDLVVSNGNLKAHVYGGGAEWFSERSCENDDQRLTPARADVRYDVTDARQYWRQTDSVTPVSDMTGDGIDDLLVVNINLGDWGGSALLFAGGEGWDNVSRNPALTIQGPADARLHEAAAARLDQTGAASLVFPSSLGGPSARVLAVPGY